MANKGRNVLLGAIGALLIGQAVYQQSVLWPTWKRDYAPQGQMTETPGLDPSQFLIALAGFREMVAGILWVRADAFFDAGNYDAILPIIRLVTILDPHQIDVYATGMWHIGYNFTDDEQRSDRRYLPTALALGAEGSKQNASTYELFFETGWMWLHKIDDIYPKAVYWIEEASKREDMPPARRNMLARAYEKDGQIDKMTDLYYKLYDEAEGLLKSDPAYQNRQSVDVIENNLDNLLVRSVQRGYQAKKLGIYDTGDYDTKPPFDVGFTAKVSVIEANVLRVEGTWNVLPLGTRIKVVLRDDNFPNSVPGGAIWDAWKGVDLDPNKDATYMQEQLYVRNQRFNKKIDMSKDPTMYPFKQQGYTLEFFYNPRSAPPHLQDKFGWNGEGMTDKNYLRDDLTGPGREGVRCMYTTLHLTRDMIKRKGEWADKVPVLMTKGFKDSSGTGSDQDIIIIPSLRGSK